MNNKPLSAVAGTVAQQQPQTWTFVPDRWNRYCALYDADGELVAYRGDSDIKAEDVLDALGIKHEYREPDWESEPEDESGCMPEHLSEISFKARKKKLK